MDENGSLEGPEMQDSLGIGRLQDAESTIHPQWGPSLGAAPYSMDEPFLKQ